MKQHYFIGIQIGEVAAKLAKPLIEQYALTQQYKVLTHPLDYHLTFVYLGALTDEEKDLLQQSLQRIADHTLAFTISMDHFHYFGNPSGPRVIYIAINPCDRLTILQQHIFEATSSYLHAHVQNRFTPHITICKKRRTNDILPNISHHFKTEHISIDAFQLFSIQPDQLPKYEIIQNFPLKKEG